MTPSHRRPDPFSRGSIYPRRPSHQRERKRENEDESDWRDDMWRARGLARLRASRAACWCRRGAHLNSFFHQKRPRRDGVFWQELAPPAGELISQDDGYDRHKMSPQAIIHNLYARPPAPCLPSSMSPRCYNLATQKGPALRVFGTHQSRLFTLSS